jgi:hypothetical protein
MDPNPKRIEIAKVTRQDFFSDSHITELTLMLVVEFPKNYRLLNCLITLVVFPLALEPIAFGLQ